MARLHRLVPILGGLLLSRGGRRIAGRHAGKLALATLAYEVWRNRRDQAGPKPGLRPGPKPAPVGRRRWSGRAPR